jgi:hypothetical protein
MRQVLFPADIDRVAEEDPHPEAQVVQPLLQADVRAPEAVPVPVRPAAAVRVAPALAASHAAGDEQALAAQCAICMNAPIEVLFLPCTHLFSCVSCSKRVARCPKCNVFIAGKVKPIIG